MRNISEIIGPFTWGLHSSPLARCLSYELFGDRWAHLLCHLFISFNFFWVHRAVKGKRQQLRLGVHFEEVWLQSRVHHDVEPCHRHESPTQPQIDQQALSQSTFGYYQSDARGTMDHSVECFSSQGIALYVKEAKTGWTCKTGNQSTTTSSYNWKFSSFKCTCWSSISNTFCCAFLALQIRPPGSNA